MVLLLNGLDAGVGISVADARWLLFHVERATMLLAAIGAFTLGL